LAPVALATKTIYAIPKGIGENGLKLLKDIVAWVAVGTIVDAVRSRRELVLENAMLRPALVSGFARETSVRSSIPLAEVPV